MLPVSGTMPKRPYSPQSFIRHIPITQPAMTVADAAGRSKRLGPDAVVRAWKLYLSGSTRDDEGAERCRRCSRSNRCSSPIDDWSRYAPDSRADAHGSNPAGRTPRVEPRGSNPAGRTPRVEPRGSNPGRAPG